MDQIAYTKGELHLVALAGPDGPLAVSEIRDVSKTAKALLVDGWGLSRHETWVPASTFHAAARGKIGRVEYRRRWWGGVKRVEIRG